MKPPKIELNQILEMESGIEIGLKSDPVFAK